MFLTVYMYQFGWLSERGGNFLNLLQKEGDLERGWGFPQKKKGGRRGPRKGVGIPSEKKGGRGSNPGGNYDLIQLLIC